MQCTLRTLFGVITLSLSGLDAQAQTTAQINGTVVDEGGGVLPGATVSAVHTETRFRRDAVTDVGGSYTLTNLPIGPYRLEVALAGFRTWFLLENRNTRLSAATFERMTASGDPRILRFGDL